MQRPAHVRVPLAGPAPKARKARERTLRNKGMPHLGEDVGGADLDLGAAN